MSTLVTENIKSPLGESKPVDDLATKGEVEGAAFSASSFSEIDGLSLKDGDQVIVASFFEEYPGIPGLYSFEANTDKSEHNGRDVISPSVPPLSSQSKGLFGFFNGDGDTAGTGVLRRVSTLEDNSLTGSAKGYYSTFAPNLPMADQNHTSHGGLRYNGQAVHPAFERVPGGFGPQEFEYWLVVTGFVEFDDQTENPILFGSHDGLRWEIPVGVTNPLIPSPSGSDFLSDVDMLHVGNELIIYYRQTNTAPSPTESEIKQIKSTDGVNWSTPVTLTGLPTDNSSVRLSPSFVYEDGVFSCWLVHDRNNGGIARVRSPDGVNFSSRVNCSLTNFPAGPFIWHLDVVKTPDGLAMISNQQPNPSEVWFSKSYDGGYTWEYVNTIFERDNRDKSYFYYRSSVVFNEDYSGAGIYATQGNAIGGNFQVVYGELVFDGNGNLIPLYRSGSKRVFQDTLVAPSAYLEDLHVGRIHGGSHYVMLGYRNSSSGITDTQYEQGVDFNYLQCDSNQIIDTPIGENYSGQVSINSITVPEGVFQMRAKYQVSLAGVGNGATVITGVIINNDTTKVYGLPSAKSGGVDQVSVNSSGGWANVIPGDTVYLGIVVIGGTGTYSLYDSTWLELEFK